VIASLRRPVRGDRIAGAVVKITAATVIWACRRLAAMAAEIPAV